MVLHFVVNKVMIIKKQPIIIIVYMLKKGPHSVWTSLGFRYVLSDSHLYPWWEAISSAITTSSGTITAPFTFLFL